MKMRVQLFIVVLIAALAFLAGSWLTFQGTRPPAAPERKILHYVDPMNPALKFDSPGIAPCGMPREPVYADQPEPGTGETDPLKSLPSGTIRIAPEKQQLIGVKTMTVEKAPWTHTLRALGRVTPDETLVYRINAATEGWIEKTMPVTTGSQVKENELLATLSFFSLEYRTLVQNYFNLVNLGDAADADLSPLVNNPQYSEWQLRQMRKSTRFAGPIADSSQIEYYRKSLYNYGITPYQLKEMERTRIFPEEVEIRSPAAGFILFRNVSPGLRLNRGEEIFRIANLSHVWVLVDIFENEAAYFKPGTQVKMELPYRKQTFSGHISPVLPQFDPATRTLKMRLVADNPGFVLRPDMFLNVEVPLNGPAAIVVPVDAVLDSGLKKTVFVAREGGYFEPRPVETGRHLGERVEIVRGLMPGEKIVVSGNFLIDSEARIQQAASGILGNIGRDPVCGMNIDEDRAKTEGRFLEYGGKIYYFCEPQCLEDFRKEPERYLKTPPPAIMPMTGTPEDAAKPAARDSSAVKPASPPKPAAAKTASANKGMAMPTVQAPAATSMFGPGEGAAAAPGEIALPAGPAGTPAPRVNLRQKRYGSPGTELIRRPKVGSAAPSVAGAAPDNASAAPGEMSPPAPRINLRQQRYGSPGTAPAAADPAMDQTLPSRTGPGEMPMSGSPDAASMFGPAGSTPMPGATPGNATFPAAPGVGPVGSPQPLPEGPSDMPKPGFPQPLPLTGTGPGATLSTAPEAPR
jgi:multidrug efflux pump subunit AcrA (membrane-fusion protein)/YHS domain-containing protein